MTSSQPRRSREHGTSPRQRGTNPRALGTNPRALGSHGAAGSPRDVAAVLTARDTAMAILRLAGVVWCATCADGGTVLASSVTVAGVRLHETWTPCPACADRPLPSSIATTITNRFGHHLEHAPHMFEAPGTAARLDALIHPPP